MTLILTIANPLAVYQSSDYQLIDRDTKRPVSDSAGSKQLQASFKDLNLMLAFTGVAAVGTQRTIDRLSAVLRGLPHESDFASICEALRQNVRPLGKFGLLTLVVSAVSIGKRPRIAFISNADWQTVPPKFKNEFSIDLRTISKPFWRISGFQDCVPETEIARLKAIAKKTDATQSEVMDKLAQINATSAGNSGGWVSDECWVTVQTGNDREIRQASRNVGGQAGFISHVVSGIDIADFIRQNFQAASGQELRLVQGAGTMGQGVPQPGPEGDPKDFILSGSAQTAILKSPSGQQAVSIEIVPIPTTVSVRHFDSVTVPFAEIRLTSIGTVEKDFPRPKFPWPTLFTPLSLDGVTVPDRQYSLGYWIQGGLHCVEICESHCPVRESKVLGDDDELHIVAPVGNQVFRLEDGDTVTGTLNARIIWQARPK
jgi:hypothetical protein